MTYTRWLPVFTALVLLPLACKDEEPCDENEVSFGTGCFPPPEEGGVAGAPSGSSGAPNGSSDATFGTPCKTDDDCGGDAPVCDNVQFNYCLQIECQEGEANEGACPADWTCFKYMDNPSACIKL